MAVFDNLYHLQICLSRNSYSRVYLAINARNQKVIIKFLLESDLFFEELARYYACDGSPYLCRLLENYPAYQVCGRRTMFQADMLRLFDHTGDCREDGELSPEKMLRSKMADVGALVLEYIEARPLLDVMACLDDHHKLIHLEKLALALRDLHVNHEFHGGLTPENVLLHEDSGRLSLIDLGYFPGKKQWLPEAFSPEHRSGSTEQVSRASDIFMFAQNFLGCLKHPEPRLIRLIQSCSRENAAARPKIEKVHHRLNHIRRGLPWSFFPIHRAKPFRLKWATLATLFLTSMIGITWVARNPFFDQRRSILDTAPLNPDQAIRDLRFLNDGYHPNPSDPETARLELARDIYHLNKARPDFLPLSIEPEDMTRPVAVFAFKTNPVLLGRRAIFKLGDGVELDGQSGYVASIRSHHMVVRFGGETRHFNFSRPNFPVGFSPDEPCVIIWDRTANLERLIEGLKPLQNIRGEAAVVARKTPLGAIFWSPNRLNTVKGTIFGAYFADNLDQFLTHLEKQLAVRFEGNAIRVAAKAGQLPIHLSYRSFNSPERNLASLCHKLGRDIGFEFEIADHLANRIIPGKRLYNVTWQEVLQEMGIGWELVTTAAESHIFVTHLKQK